MRPKRKVSASPQSNPLSARRLPSKSPSHSLLPATSLRLPRRPTLSSHLPLPTCKPKIPEINVRVSCRQLLQELSSYRVREEVRLGGWSDEQGKESEQRKERVVVSKIGEFYEEYNCFCRWDYSQAGSLTWLILSNAINRQQIQQEFNRTYDPIRFFFLIDLQDVVNFLNFRHLSYKHSTKPLTFFSSIINFDNYSNQFAIILEFSQNVELHRPVETNQLWLVSKQQVGRLETGQYRCCFLGECSGRVGGIQVMEVEGQKMVYILVVDDFNAYLSKAGIKQIEKTVDSAFLKKALFTVQQPTYYQKVVSNYLSQQIVINLVDFPDHIAEIIHKQAGYFTRISQADLPSPSYSLYLRQKRADDVFGLEVKQDSSVVQEITRSRTHFQKIQKLKAQYSQLPVEKYYFAVFGLKDNQFAKELHLLTKQTVHQPINFQIFSKVQEMKVILIANLSDNLKKLLPSNVTLMSISDDHVTAHENIIDIIKTHTQAIQQPPIITSVTNFSTEFNQYQSQPRSVYQQMPISEFTLFLQSLQKNSTHLLILEMEDYTEQREHQLGEAELLKQVYFEVYLLYGNQFIFRNKNGKYTFLKKEQLLSKIKNIIENRHKQQMQENLSLQQGESDYNFHSDIQHNRCIQPSNAYSTPNLYYFAPTRSSIVICVPKSVPYHTLLDRAVQMYCLLVYSHPNQVKEMLKYLPSDHYAVVVAPSQHVHSFTANSNTHELIGVSELTEKTVRNQVDRIISKFQLGQKRSNISRKRKSIPAVILYNHLDEKQTKIINTMSQIFQDSKIMTIVKKQFKNIKKSYSIYHSIDLYEIGMAEIAYAKRLKTLFDVFKVFMSPEITPLEYSTERLQFSSKQLFLRALIDKNKKTKIGKAHDLSLSRSLSPKAKSILQKECFITEAGLVLLESEAVNKLMKKEKFSTNEQLMSLCLTHLSKGSQVVVVMNENQFFSLKDEVSVYGREIIWIVLVADHGKCIIREANIVFCREQQFEKSLALITQAYRSFKSYSFEFKQAHPNKERITGKENQSQNKCIVVELKDHIYSLLKEPSEEQLKINIYFNQSITDFELSKLSSSLVFNNKVNLNSILSYFSASDGEEEGQKSIEIICDHRNKKFLQQSLKIIGQEHFILITFDHISELITYSSPSQGLFVLQKDICKIKVHNMLLLSAEETPQSFSKRLKIYLMALQRA